MATKEQILNEFDKFADALRMRYKQGETEAGTKEIADAITNLVNDLR